MHHTPYTALLVIADQSRNLKGDVNVKVWIRIGLGLGLGLGFRKFFIVYGVGCRVYCAGKG